MADIKGWKPTIRRLMMSKKVFFRMIVCAVLGIGLVLAGCDNGTNSDGGGGMNTGGNGYNNGGNNDNTGGNNDNTGDNNGENIGGNGNDNTGSNGNTGGNGNGNNGGNTGGNGNDNTGDNGNTGGDGNGNGGNNAGGETTAKPGTPTGVKATALSSTSIRITWDTVSGATSYKIYSPEEAGSSSGFVELDTSTTNSYTDTVVRPGQTWYYKVSAVNSAGESAQSSAVSAKTPSSGGGGGGNTGGGGTTTSKPNTPYGKPVIKAQTSDSFTLEWNASLRATGYKLYRSSSISPAFGLVYSGPNTTYKDTGLTSGITYKYKVSATNSAGDSDYSDVLEYMK
jgi:hypothetical protein